MFEAIRKHTALKLFLPMLFLAYIGSISLFPHTHIINGTTIVHSHPFAGEHSHQAGEAECILHLSVFWAENDIPVTRLPELFRTFLNFILVPATADSAVSTFVHYETRRGPPSVNF